MGDTDTILVSTGAAGPAATTLPTVNSARDTRPDTGATICV